MIVPIVLAGGVGSRLWPLSRELMPKQFLTLHGDSSMLQATLQRLAGLAFAQSYVICHEDHRFIAAEQLRQIQQLNHNLILEPVSRNTAPAIALAALHCLQQQQDPLLLVLAADHVITDAQAFQRAVTDAIPQAAAGKLVTFGIVPTHAETGYGYIRKGPALSEHSFAIAAFVEKPDRTTAETYVASGDYLWNSGMFLLRASVYLAELKQHRPDIYTSCQQAMQQVASDLDFIRIDKTAFANCPADSIDYAVMEHTQNGVVVPLDAGWNDVGSWSALSDIHPKDAQGNVAIGDVLMLDSHNNFVLSESALVATVGVRDMVVVQTKDAVLVASREQEQQVKTLVQQLKAAERTEHQVHREVYRPWGKYDLVDQAPRYQVKRITVTAGEKLSTQMHHHRAEHWIVVAGTAKVTLDEREFLLTENQSVYIPPGAVHALENPATAPLELIEVQTGSYLGEDDIVRFSDRYGRS